MESVTRLALLDELGFVSTVRWYADEFAKRSGINVSLELPDSSVRLPDTVELAFFRILQESLTNVHRHSGSSAVEIHLKVGKSQAEFTVKDFGHGIPADFVRGAQPNGNVFSVGLTGMQERIHDLGGQFEIRSGGDGTAIIVSIPLVAENSDGHRASDNSSRSAQNPDGWGR